MFSYRYTQRKLMIVNSLNLVSVRLIAMYYMTVFQIPILYVELGFAIYEKTEHVFLSDISLQGEFFFVSMLS